MSKHNTGIGNAFPADSNGQQKAPRSMLMIMTPEGITCSMQQHRPVSQHLTWVRADVVAKADAAVAVARVYAGEALLVCDSDDGICDTLLPVFYDNNVDDGDAAAGQSSPVRSASQGRRPSGPGKSTFSYAVV